MNHNTARQAVILYTRLLRMIIFMDNSRYFPRDYCENKLNQVCLFVHHYKSIPQTCMHACLKLFLILIENNIILLIIQDRGNV